MMPSVLIAAVTKCVRFVRRRPRLAAATTVTTRVVRRVTTSRRAAVALVCAGAAPVLLPTPATPPAPMALTAPSLPMPPTVGTPLPYGIGAGVPLLPPLALAGPCCGGGGGSDMNVVPQPHEPGSAPVPEPATLPLLLFGITGLATVLRVNTQKKSEAPVYNGMGDALFCVPQPITASVGIDPCPAVGPTDPTEYVVRTV